MEPRTQAEESGQGWESLAVLWMIGVLVALPVLAGTAGLLPDEEDAIPTIIYGMLTFHLPAALIIVLALWRRVPAGQRAQAMAWRRPPHLLRETALAWLAALVCLVVTVFCMHKMGIQPEPAPYVRWLREGSPGVVLALFVAAGLVAPVTEELMFRLALNGALEPRVGRVLALIVTSLVFAACHGRPSQIPVLFLVAAVLQILRNRQGSIIGAILAHACYNSSLLIAGLYVMRWRS